jgi:hypothetical protein
MTSSLQPLSLAGKPALSPVQHCSHRITIPARCVNRIRPTDRINVPVASIVPPLHPPLVHREPRRSPHVHIPRRQKRDHCLTYFLNLCPELVPPLPPRPGVPGRPRKYANEKEARRAHVQRRRERKQRQLPTPPPDVFCNLFLTWKPRQQ